MSGQTRIHLRIIPALLLFLATVVAADVPEVQGPVFTPGDEVAGAAAGSQEAPAIAAGGGGFLAVWTDLRTASFNGDDQSARDVYAARLDAGGDLIDTTPIIVNQSFGYQRNPKASWNGQHWLVVWENQSPTEFFYETAICAARVAPDGTVIDTTPVTVFADGASGASFSVTSNGSDWLVVAQSHDAGGAGIVGIRVAGDGTVVDAPPVVLVPDTYFLYFGISVHSAQGEYLLVWDASGDFKGQRFQADLTPIAGELALPGLLVTSSGTGYFVVWSSAGIVGSAMSVAGVLDNPSGVLVTTDGGSETNASWDGTNWWVSWRSPIDGIKAARVSTAGAVLDPGGVALNPAIEDSMQQHRIAGSPAGGVHVVWRDHRCGCINPYDVFGAHYSAGGQPGVDEPLSRAAPAQTQQDLAEGPGQFLAVFRSELSGSRRILAQRLDTTGNAIDAEPIEIASGAYVSSPAAAWNGSLYLVVWQESGTEGGTILGCRVSASGALIDAVPFVVMPGGSPDVAALGDVFLVAGVHFTFGIQHWVVPFAARVDGATGALLDPTPVQLGNIFARVPRVATFFGRWLVTWQRNFSHDDPQANLHAALVESDGATGGEFVVSYNAFTPDVAVSGSTAMIVFRKNSDANADNDVAARRMLPDGSLPDPEFVLSAGPDRQRAPAVTWDGARFVAVWEDMRNSATFFDERTDLIGARIDDTGQVLDPLGFDVAVETIPEQHPALASMGGHTLLAAAVFHDQVPRTAYRTGVFHLGGTFTDPPRVDFDASPATGCSPLGVQFTDQSIGDVTAWSWSFGDGADSTLQNPLHTYSTPGTYTVYLTAGGALGFDSVVKLDQILATAPTVADFVASVTTGCAPLTVDFTDMSAGSPGAWSWTFGDNGFSGEQSPSHTYEYPGSYTVMLTVAGSCGADSVTRPAHIQIDEMCGVRDYALEDLPVEGSVFGSYLNTHADGGSTESIQEVVTGGTTLLDHRWRFDVTGGPEIGFYADVFRLASSDGDDFRFEVSADNTSFTPFLTVTQQSGSQHFVPMPAGLQGTVYVRLVDTDRTPGSTSRDMLTIDEMYIESSVPTPEHPVEALMGLQFTGRDSLNWLPAPSASKYDIMWGDLESLRASGSIGAATCGWDDHVGTSLVDGTTPPAGSGYYYVIRGDAESLQAGTLDNPPGISMPTEERDQEVGTDGGAACVDSP